MKKISALLLAAALILTLLAGCGSGNGASSASLSGSSSITTKTVTDLLGRSVTVPSEIKTVATAGSAARILTYAGCADKLVGVTDMDKKATASMPYTMVNKDKFASLTSVGAGGATDSQYTEALVTLHPDIIFSLYLDASAADELQKKTNIPVVAIDCDGIFSDSVYKAIELVGDIMGTKDHCEQVITAMKGWQKDLNDRTKDIADTDKPAVYVGAVSFKGGHGIEGTYGQYPPFVAINAKNVVDKTGEKSAVLIDKEKLLTWNPDIIFLTPANMNMVNEDYSKNKSFYDDLKAVKNGKVYSQISYNYNGTNIELAIVDAYYAGMVIYPDKFSDVDLNKKGDEIFKVMLGQTYMYELENAGNSFGKITIGA